MRVLLTSTHFYLPLSNLNLLLYASITAHDTNMVGSPSPKTQNTTLGEYLFDSRSTLYLGIIFLLRLERNLVIMN